MNDNIWTKQEIEDRVSLLSKKYYPGYVDKNPDAAIYIFQRALEYLNETGKTEYNIDNFDLTTTNK